MKKQTSMTALVVALFLFFLGLAFPCKTQADVPGKVPPVRCVYFVPAGMEPLAGRRERLERVMRCVQDFYRNGMQKNGYGPMTFKLEWDETDKLKLYEIRGKKQQDEYGRNDAGVVRDEVREALRSQYGIEANEEVIVIFQMLLKRDGEISVELGPYVGSGSHLSGTAWVYEDDRLDADLLPSKEPGGYYYRPCSLGQFNTHYIGGVAHELGHAFGLPHACELDDERSIKGRALMGGGNHTFGEELRDQGPGTFLCASSALRLSKVRAFVGDFQGSRERAHWVFHDLRAAPKEGNHRSFVIDGRVMAMPKLLGVIAYNDDATNSSDYDAKTWTAPVAADGSFHFEITELKTVPYQLRLVGVHENGAVSQLALDYTVKTEMIDLSAINIAVPLDNLRRLFQAGNRAEIEALAKKHRKNTDIRLRAEHLARLMQMSETVVVAELPNEVRETDLSQAEFVEAKPAGATSGVHMFRKRFSFRSAASFSIRGFTPTPHRVTKSIWPVAGKRWTSVSVSRTAMTVPFVS